MLSLCTVYLVGNCYRAIISDDIFKKGKVDTEDVCLDRYVALVRITAVCNTVTTSVQSSSGNFNGR